MDHEKTRVEVLVRKMLKGQISIDEEIELNHWYNQDQDRIIDIPTEFELSEERLKNRILMGIRASIGKTQIFQLWPKIAVAAAVLAVIATGLYFYINNANLKSNRIPLYANDIAPGRSEATLILGNGNKVKLSAIANGKIAEESGISVTKTADGLLVYEIKDSGIGTGKNNTLTTANGETYSVILPDQTKVWLNAASSLTYSNNLSVHGKRRVKLSGEAYFEVSRDKAHPFVVETSKQEVEVLGTHFNVSSYADESVTRTTLLEGSVRVSSKTARQILKPGEQAILISPEKFLVEQVDTDNAVAWKNGYFQFEGETLESIMRKVSRWYDVDISWQDDNLKTMAFVGTISKYKKVSQILKKLQMTNELDFKIEERQILICSRLK